MKVKALYTVAELAKMSGLIDSRGHPDTRRFVKTLKAEQVPIHVRGSRRVQEVYITDLNRKVPALWEAIQAAARENGD